MIKLNQCVATFIFSFSLLSIATGSVEKVKSEELTEGVRQLPVNSTEKDVRFALSWLSQVDEGKYDECFRQLSRFSLARGEKERFFMTLCSLGRAPLSLLREGIELISPSNFLGKVISRNLYWRMSVVHFLWGRDLEGLEHVSVRFVTSPMMSGETRQVVFHTFFENDKNMYEETVSLSKGEGGGWEVLHYYVRQIPSQERQIHEKDKTEG